MSFFSSVTKAQQIELSRRTIQEVIIELKQKDELEIQVDLLHATIISSQRVINAQDSLVASLKFENGLLRKQASVQLDLSSQYKDDATYYQKLYKAFRRKYIGTVAGGILILVLLILLLL